jgi:hypothetical protein
VTKFRVNDPVRIIAHPTRYFDHVGTVTAVEDGLHPWFHVAGVEDVPLWFTADELILAENGVVTA